MTREEIINLLAKLSDNYNIKISNAAGKASAWEMNLAEYPAEKIYKAARFHMATSKFFPTPADLIKAIPRAELLYPTPAINAIEAHTKDIIITPQDHAFLDALCRKVGLGCNPDDTIYADLNAWLNGGTGLEPK